MSTKRSNGEGSKYFDDNKKLYYFVISYTDPESGKTKRKKFSSKTSYKEAKAKADTFIAGLIAPVKDTNMTLGDWLQKWLVVYKKNNITIKTYERYESHIRLNIIPYIGDMKLTDITKLSIQEHLNYILDNGGGDCMGLAPTSVNAVKNIIVAALTEALDNDLIKKHPCHKIESIHVDRHEFLVLTEEEGRRLIKFSLKNNTHAWIIVVLALYTGMRIGEIFGLQWRYINFEAKYLSVVNTVVTTSHGVKIQSDGKTKAARRKIDLPDYVLHALKRYKQWQIAASKKYGRKYAYSPWVLANPQGDPRSPNSFSAHDYKDILEQSGIDRSFRIHDMRHTHATWLLSKNVPVKVVSERLGHSSIRITLDIYGHVIPTMQEQAVNVLNNIL